MPDYTHVKDNLPEKLSELLELALKHFSDLRADDRYHLDLSNYHQLSDSGQVHVCLAGALMVEELDVPHGTERVVSFDFAPSIGRKLRAIDYAQKGEWGTAFGLFNRAAWPSPEVQGELNMYPPHFHLDAFDDWAAWLQTQIDTLKRHDL